MGQFSKELKFYFFFDILMVALNGTVHMLKVDFLVAVIYYFGSPERRWQSSERQKGQL